MRDLAAKPRQRNDATPAKNRVGVCGSKPNKHTYRIDPQALQPRRVEPSTLTKLASGRLVWLSQDPLGEAGGINLYGYVGNGPTNGWDPLGLACQKYQNRISVLTVQIAALKRKRATTQAKLAQTLNQLISDPKNLRSGSDGIGPQSLGTANRDSFDWHRRRRQELRNSLTKNAAIIQRLERDRKKAIANLATCKAAEKAAKRKAAASLLGRGAAPVGAALTGWEIGNLMNKIPTGGGKNWGDRLEDLGGFLHDGFNDPSWNYSAPMY